MTPWQGRTLCVLDQGAVHYRFSAVHVGKPALVLLHQAPSDARMFSALAPLLSQQFNVYAPDIPGFGFSDALAPGYNVMDLATALMAWMTATGLERVDLFGHHTGAALAIALAAHWPQRVAAVSLSGPTLLTDAQKNQLQTAGDLPPVAEDGSHLIKLWQRLRNKDAAAPFELTQRECDSALRAGAHWGHTYRAIAGNPTGEQLAAIRCPVQVMAGDCDPLFSNVEPTLALLAHGQKATLPAGAGTYVCERHAPALARNLQSFFLME